VAYAIFKLLRDIHKTNGESIAQTPTATIETSRLPCDVLKADLQAAVE